MNDQSLERVNAFLAAVAERVRPGDLLTETPAEIGRDLGFPDALSTARAVRALIARKRLEAAQGSYRLLDAAPVAAGEREAMGRRTRKPRVQAAGGRAAPGSSTYSDFGRATVDRLIDLGREVATLRANLRTAREEGRELREAREEAERRARGLADRVRELEGRAEMAESNLRTLLASARGRQGPGADAHVSDSEMAAILGVLRGDESEAEEGAPPAG
jgi:hypothetical protein